MSKTYTAQEMRDEADFQEGCHGKPNLIATMLRQAANLMDSEEKREKKYEYAELSIVDGRYAVYCRHTDSLAYAKERQCKGTTLVRRPVGEWEEVKNG